MSACASPGYASKAFNRVEMPVSAQHRQAVLPGEGGNPQVIHGDWSARLFQLKPDLRVGLGCRLFHDDAAKSGYEL